MRMGHSSRENPASVSEVVKQASYPATYSPRYNRGDYQTRPRNHRSVGFDPEVGRRR